MDVFGNWLVEITNQGWDATSGNCNFYIHDDGEGRHVSLVGDHMILISNNCPSQYLATLNPITGTVTRADAAYGSTSSTFGLSTVFGAFADFSRVDDNSFDGCSQGPTPICQRYTVTNWTAPATLSTTAFLHGDFNNASGSSLKNIFNAAVHSTAPAAPTLNVTGGGSNSSINVYVTYYTSTGEFPDSLVSASTSTGANWTSFTVNTPANPSDVNVLGYNIYCGTSAGVNDQIRCGHVANPTWGSGTSPSISAPAASGPVPQTCGTGCKLDVGNAIDDRYAGPRYAGLIGGLGQDLDSVIVIVDKTLGALQIDFSNWNEAGDWGYSGAISISGITSSFGTKVHKVTMLSNGYIYVVPHNSLTGPFTFNPATGQGWYCASGSPCYGVDHIGAGANTVTANRNVASQNDPITHPDLTNPNNYVVLWPTAIQNALGINGVFDGFQHHHGSINSNDQGWVLGAFILTGAAGGRFTVTYPLDGELYKFRASLPSMPIIRDCRIYVPTSAEGTGYYYQTVSNANLNMTVEAFQSSMMAGLGTYGGTNDREDVFACVEPLGGGTKR